MDNRLIIAITGASGSIYVLRLIETLLSEPLELHLIISRSGLEVLKHESKCRYADLGEFIKTLQPKNDIKASCTIHANDDLFAPVASGSFTTCGMVVVPCSMKTLSAIANGYADKLIERAADVTLKEKRPLILVTRETPYNLIHLRNMLAAAEAGTTIMPASPGFYNHPRTMNDLADFMTNKICDHLRIPAPGAIRWQGGEVTATKGSKE